MGRGKGRGHSTAQVQRWANPGAGWTGSFSAEHQERGVGDGRTGGAAWEVSESSHPGLGAGSKEMGWGGLSLGS